MRTELLSYCYYFGFALIDCTNIYLGVTILDSIKRILIRHRRAVGALSMIFAVVLIFCAVNSPLAITAAKTDRKLPIYCVERDDKCVSLTFDAAWGNEDTQQLIDILGNYGVKATFFVVGEWVDKYPESVKALHDAGHEVMTHSDDHAHFAQLSQEQIIANINASCDKIEAVTGVRPKLFRCPYGEYNDAVIETLNSMGMYTIQWDVDSLDWKDLGAGEITERVTGKVQSGSIVLFHNAAKHTPKALPGIIEKLLGDGYKIVPVSEILLTGKYEMDHTGKMCPTENA
ncbi:MAG: polysaccharide deacetylase family protein [Oscillospiraceae bacterium]|nr:polysaccharide deacetylase family protein [Oscillospiraceae bacterium]